MVELGKKYKDIITGFEGIATGRATYLTGCTQISLAPQAGKDGSGKTRWVDEPRLKPVGKTKAIKLQGVAAKPGGPHDAPSRQTAPIH